MIPLRDVIPSRTRPVITILIIALNVAVFAGGLWMSRSELAAMAMRHGVVPAWFEWRALATSILLHASWLHLGVNCLYLWLFGETVEDRVGHGRFAVLYFFSGTAAALGQMAANPASTAPIVGASGAMAGVLGAYFAIFPRSRVLLLVPTGRHLDLVEVPALSFLLAWLLLQLGSGLASPGLRGASLAFAGQATGFAAGFGLAMLLRRPERLTVDWLE